MLGVMRGLGDEARAPKYAHVERERRWLVEPSRRPPLDGMAHVLIEDRYIRGTRLRLRRMTDSATGEQSLKLTKKYEADDPLARPIVTAYLTEAEYGIFAALPAAALAKRRYPLPHDGFDWSLDAFAAPLDGLEILEIECPDASSLAACAAPPWAGPEISADPKYQGGALAAEANG